MTNSLLNIAFQSPPTIWDFLGTFMAWSVIAIIIIALVENMR